MRQFVVLGHEAPTTPEFSLEDLPGSAGRLDVLCRCLNAAFFRSHDIREDVRVRLVLGDEFTLRLEGRELQGLNPDERSTAARIRNALERREAAIGHQAVETSPGIYLSRRGVEAALRDAAAEGQLLQLHEDGTPIIDGGVPADPVFVLSDHQDFTDAEQGLLEELNARRIRLGPTAVHADHAITVAQNYLDTDGFETF
ncbi:tRNA (pseudouridine(54)-N(1))-methyltransferase TrmY [Halorhabdus sp. CBA1104]|uniref:tRNA (pseudouridine(54)-N(1))-methyltransferase TrmY n=1 Tax=Halorhabdus sp. CBA1104 TaxID=1380432 RepID=UPI0012B1C64C|nr:tRNA (pseudouridine(54)-N(1))-methyltransferase TrmY [Halorhabdus sp. CBA1104]QGN07402.1 tRNA (pseudouridine(54)-N(1))-methyltransferase TrmY [Halorhabdus sp. CBA1104]